MHLRIRDFEKRFASLCCAKNLLIIPFQCDFHLFPVLSYSDCIKICREVTKVFVKKHSKLGCIGNENILFYLYNFLNKEMYHGKCFKY